MSRANLLTLENVFQQMALYPTQIEKPCTVHELKEVWDGLSDYILDHLERRVGMELPQFGTFGLMSVKESAEVREAQRFHRAPTTHRRGVARPADPFFIMDPKFERLFCGNSLPEPCGYEKTRYKFGMSTPVVRIQYGVMASRTAANARDVSSWMVNIFKFIGESVFKGMMVEVPINRVGQVSLTKRKVTIRWDKNLLIKLGSTMREADKGPQWGPRLQIDTDPNGDAFEEDGELDGRGHDQRWAAGAARGASNRGSIGGSRPSGARVRGSSVPIQQTQRRDRDDSPYRRGQPQQNRGYREDPQRTQAGLKRAAMNMRPTRIQGGGGAATTAPRQGNGSPHRPSGTGGALRAHTGNGGWGHQNSEDSEDRHRKAFILGRGQPRGRTFEELGRQGYEREQRIQRVLTARASKPRNGAGYAPGRGPGYDHARGRRSSSHQPGGNRGYQREDEEWKEYPDLEELGEMDPIEERISDIAPRNSRPGAPAQASRSAKQQQQQRFLDLGEVGPGGPPELIMGDLDDDQHHNTQQPCRKGPRQGDNHQEARRRQKQQPPAGEFGDDVAHMAQAIRGGQAPGTPPGCPPMGEPVALDFSWDDEDQGKGQVDDRRRARAHRERGVQAGGRGGGTVLDQTWSQDSTGELTEETPRPLKARGRAGRGGGGARGVDMRTMMDPSDPSDSDDLAGCDIAPPPRDRSLDRSIERVKNYNRQEQAEKAAAESGAIFSRDEAGAKAESRRLAMQVAAENIRTAEEKEEKRKQQRAELLRKAQTRSLEGVAQTKVEGWWGKRKWEKPPTSTRDALQCVE